ncbi:MAG: SsrA-binding protein SmpB [candidate division WOR-3 bacterium]|jgi:SsrA-binding protein|nr:SsrA-binding protein SmpB [candidate division WOR-3 bacterium]
MNVIAENRRARHDYFIEDTLEAGIVLQGSEVKSLRDHQASITEAYCIIQGGEVYIVGMHIAAYSKATFDVPESGRKRKLLLHRHELKKLYGKTQRRGYTLIPLKLYFSDRGIAKLTIGLCRGKQTIDKRDTLKRRAMEREQRRMGV